MKKLQAVPPVLLVASAALGIEILWTDSWLWSSPVHSYGLIAFVVFDLVLATVGWKATKLAATGSGLFGAIQFSAMVGDALMGQPAGVPARAWESYLLGNLSFMVLLGVQMLIVAWAILSSRVIAKQMQKTALPVGTK